MANFESHLKQAHHNIRILQSLSQSVSDSYDWQITVSFYVANHVANAHLSRFGLNYRSHHDVCYALNPIAKRKSSIHQAAYLDYMRLLSLSRKSRYLAISMNAKDTSKAIRCLDNVLSYFNAAYKIDVGKDIPIKCDPLPLSVLKAIS